MNPPPVGALKMTSTRLSLLSTPKHRKKYTGGASFACAELAKVRSQNLLEKAAHSPVLMNSASESRIKGPTDGGGVSGGCSRGGTSGANDEGSEPSSTGVVDAKSDKGVGNKNSSVTTDDKPMKSITVQRTSSLPPSAKKLWKMPEHFVKLLKPEESSDIVEGVESEAETTALTSTKQSYAENLKKTVTAQSRLYGGKVRGRGRKNAAMGQPEGSSAAAVHTDTATATATVNSLSIPAANATKDVAEMGKGRHVIVQQSNTRSAQQNSTRTEAFFLEPKHNPTAVTAATISYSRDKRTAVGGGTSALSVRYNRNNVCRGKTGTGTGTGTRTDELVPTETSDPTPFVRAMASKVKKPVPSHVSNSPSTPTITSTTPSTAPPQSDCQPVRHTGKTRSFGNATIAYQKKVDSLATPKNRRNIASIKSTASSERVTETKAARKFGRKELSSGSPSRSRKPMLKKTMFSSRRSGTVTVAATVETIEGSSSSVEEGSADALPASGRRHESAKQKKVELVTGTSSSKSIAGAGESTHVPPSQQEKESSPMQGEGNTSRSVVITSSPRSDSSNERSGSADTRRVSEQNSKTNMLHHVDSDERLTDRAEESSAKNKPCPGHSVKGPGALGSRIGSSSELGRNQTYFQSLASYGTTASDSGEGAKVNAERNTPTEKIKSEGTGQHFKVTVTSSSALATATTTVSSVTASPAITVTAELEDDDVEASAAAIELRNARRRFRLSRDAAAAAAESRKKTNSRREFNFVASARRSTTSGVNADGSGSGSGRSESPGSPERKMGSDGRRFSSGSGTNLPSHTKDESPKKVPPPTSAVSHATGAVTSYIGNMKSPVANSPKQSKKKVRFLDEENSTEEKLNYASVLKPKVVIRSKPPLTPKPRFGTPPPRNVEEALLFSKLRADNLRQHEEKHSSSVGAESRAGEDGESPLPSVRSDVTMSLDRDEYLTFDKESFVF